MIYLNIVLGIVIVLIIIDCFKNGDWK